MKKKTLITAGLLVSVLCGPMASADPVLPSDAAPKAVDLPIFDYAALSPLQQCEFQSSFLRSQLDRFDYTR